MDDVKNSKTFELIAFVYLTMMISGASSLASNDFIQIITLLILIVYGCMKRMHIFDNILIYIFGGWILINLVASIFLKESIGYYQFAGKIVLIYTAFLILSYIGKDFWDKYEKFLYILVIISSIFYLASLSFPSFFNSLTYLFRPFTNEFFYQKEAQQHYFYSFFFVFRGGDTLFRNNGFMWEPGAYAMILIFLLTYNFSKNRLLFNKHNILYIIALISTFSTAGYVSLFILLSLFLLKEDNIYAKLLIIICGLLSISWLLNADFLIPKIERFVQFAQEGSLSHQGYRDLYEANRILSFKLLFDKFLQFPFGWGCVQDASSYIAKNQIATVNGLGNMLVTWGGIGFCFFIISIWLFYYQYSKSIFTASILFTLIIISFFSNPIENNILPYIMSLSTYLQTYNQKHIELQ